MGMLTKFAFWRRRESIEPIRVVYWTDPDRHYHSVIAKNVEILRIYHDKWIEVGNADLLAKLMEKSGRAKLFAALDSLRRRP